MNREKGTKRGRGGGEKKKRKRENTLQRVSGIDLRIDYRVDTFAGPTVKGREKGGKREEKKRITRFVLLPSFHAPPSRGS